jgi:hypothetical protein
MSRGDGLVIITDTLTLTRVHMGRLPLSQGIEAGNWETQGPPSLARAMMSWSGLSPFAEILLACDEEVTAGPGAPGSEASGPASLRTPASPSP